MSVIVIPDIQEPDVVRQIEVKVDEIFSLYCPVTSLPIPEISWFFNERSIPESDANFELSDDRRRLRVLKAKVANSGFYKCVARNSAGNASASFHVEVLVPPNLDETKYKRQIVVIQNRSVSLECPVKGIPEPSVSWLANGQLIEVGKPSIRGIQLSEDAKSVSSGSIF